MGNAYRAIVSAGSAAVGDATAADVLTGKTFSGAVGSGVAGTMPNNGAVTQTLAAGASYTIPEGYHNGSGTVTAQSAGIAENSYVFISSAGAKSDGTIPSSLPLGQSGSCFLDVTSKTSFVCNASFAFVAFNSLTDMGTPTAGVANQNYNISAYKYLLIYNPSGQAYTFS